MYNNIVVQGFREFPRKSGQKPIVETLKNFGFYLSKCEDWFTECIKLALCYNYQLAEEFIRTLFTYSPEELRKLNGFKINEINTQVEEEKNIYDLQFIITDAQNQSKKIIVEVKRGAEISKKRNGKKGNQLDDYIDKTDYLALISTRWHSDKDLDRIIHNSKYLHPVDRYNFLWCEFYELFKNYSDEHPGNELLKFIKEEVMKGDKQVNLKKVKDYLERDEENLKNKEEIYSLIKDPRVRADIAEFVRKQGAQTLRDGAEGYVGYKFKLKDRETEVIIGFNIYWPESYTKELQSKYEKELKKYIIEIPLARSKRFVYSPCIFVYRQLKHEESAKNESYDELKWGDVNIYVGIKKGKRSKEGKKDIKIAIFNLYDIVEKNPNKDFNIATFVDLIKKCIEIVLK